MSHQSADDLVFNPLTTEGWCMVVEQINNLQFQDLIP